MRGRSTRKQLWLGGAASAALHVAVIAALVFSAQSVLPPARPHTPTLYIEIEPRPLLDGEKPRIVAPQPDITPAPSADRNQTTAASASITPNRPQPRLAQGVSPDPSAQDSSAWQVAPQSAEDEVSRRVGQSLRTSVLGCQYPDRLTQQERDVCDDREGERTTRALERLGRISGTGNSRRDARLEAEGRQRLQSYESRRNTPLDSERGNGGVVEGVGSNFGMGVAGRHLDPTHQVDSVAPIQTKRDGPVEHRIRRTPN
ncbi:hypothetical protein [Brevundimonas sp.]|uniref:hypothetical protein n=1 Tax=Brevundimonas sp. TaxID=1871086 RepID=UPI002FC929E2